MLETLGFVVHNDQERGWDFTISDPEFWRFQDRLVVPEGQLLDLGTSTRSALFFALHGMEVTGYTTSHQVTDELTQLVEELESELPITINLKESDIEASYLGERAFDTAILSYLFAHFPSKERALRVIDKAYMALKPGGHIWIRAIGKGDTQYSKLQSLSETQPAMYRQIDEDVIEHPCPCSGQWRQDPILFFGQTDLLQYLCHKGAEIVHSQMLPALEGEANIMFGEDSQNKVDGLVTILAQKPS